MTLEKLAQLIAQGFAAIADGQDAIATELRMNRVDHARAKSQRELDLQAQQQDMSAMGAQVAQVRRLVLVSPDEPAE